MRDQYAGDVSDVLKFGLLRKLAGADKTLGVAWYYVPENDGRPDGLHIEWRNEPAWQQVDSHVYTSLSALPERSVCALERAEILPKSTLFHREPMPTQNERADWCLRKRSSLHSADIVFLDPDNGIGDDPVKHATLSEIQGLRRNGRAVVVITFPGRVRHDQLVQRLHERLRTGAGATNAFTVRTCVSVPRGDGTNHVMPRFRWFTVVDADDHLKARALDFVRALAVVPRATARLSEG